MGECFFTLPVPPFNQQSAAASLFPILRNLYEHFPSAWTRYGYINAFNPSTGWYDPDVVGIGLGIVALMVENYRTGSSRVHLCPILKSLRPCSSSVFARRE